MIWTQRLLAVALVLQTVELLQMRGAFSDDGIWSWPVLRQEQKIFSWILNYRSFVFLLFFRLLGALLILVAPTPALFVFLFFSTLLISVRWRGTFNGGSDYMTLVVLTGVGGAALFSDHPKMVEGSLWYIAIQTVMSYFVAGLSKMAVPRWRSGEALGLFMSASNYDVPITLRRLMSRRWIAFASSWIVILFECSFPLVLSSPKVCLPYIGAALLFHLANFYIFGLNRFVFAWSAAYPTLYYCLTRLK